MRTTLSISGLLLLSASMACRAAGSIPSPKHQEAQSQAAPVVTPAAPVTADQILDRGKDDYRAGDLAAAIDDLKSAISRYVPVGTIGVDTKQSWLKTQPQLETAFVYLSLADASLGLDADATATITQLLEAERIKPIYAALPLDDDAAAFEPLVVRLVPAASLTPNRQLARSAAAHTPQSAVVSSQQTATSPYQPPMSQASAISEKEKHTPLAAVTESTNETSPATSTTPLPDFPSAPAMGAVEPLRQDNTVGSPAIAPTLAPPDAEAQKRMLESVRQADVAAEASRLDEADAIYARVVAPPNAPREILAAAALGFYRTGNFEQAVKTFRRLGPLGHGEEDLRYYEAIALYEIGDFDEALVQLNCALPYIEQNDDVLHYRAKIEGTAAAWAALR